MKKSHVLLAILAGVGLLIVLLNCQVPINQGINFLLHRRSMAQYKSLTSGDISSENYEIRQLVNGSMLGFGSYDNQIIFDTFTDNFIAKSVEKFDEMDTSAFYHLWKINKQGFVIDSITVDKNAILFESFGFFINFEDDSYNDWMQSGNRAFRAVDEVINADTLMGEDDLLQKFNLMKSEGRLLGDLTNEGIVKYYFETKNRIAVLYGLENMANFNDDYLFLLEKKRFVLMDAELKWYSELEQESDVEPNNYLYLYRKHFLYLKKRKWYFSYGSSASTGYHGVAFVNLHYKNEILKFKTYAFKESGDYKSNITTFYSVSGELPSFFIVDDSQMSRYYGHDIMFAPNGVFEQEGIQYAKETGLYVVAEK